MDVVDFLRPNTPLVLQKKKSALSLFSKSSKPVKHLVEAMADMGTKQPAMYPWISRPVNPPKNLPAPGPHMAASPVWWDDPICIYIYVCVFSSQFISSRKELTANRGQANAAKTTSHGKRRKNCSSNGQLQTLPIYRPVCRTCSSFRCCILL